MGDKVMKTTQAWGWLAAGVLALGLNGIYQDGGAEWVHRNVDGAIARIADRSEAVLALAAGRADWFAAKAGVLGVRNETASCRVASAMARFQTKIARRRMERRSLKRCRRGKKRRWRAWKRIGRGLRRKWRGYDFRRWRLMP